MINWTISEVVAEGFIKFFIFLYFMLRKSGIINADMPWFALVHHHLLIYNHTGPAWKLYQPWFHIVMHDKFV